MEHRECPVSTSEGSVTAVKATVIPPCWALYVQVHCGWKLANLQQINH
jgi:hypothetical protein